MGLGKLFGPVPSYPLVAGLLPAEERPARPELRFIAGPCSVEGEEFMVSLARQLKAAGATMLRGGCYLYGTYPPAIPGFVLSRMDWIGKAADEVDLPFIVECLDMRDLVPYFDRADWIQVGMRHSQHYPLLQMVGEMGKPVLLKRGSWMKLDELLGAVEYVLKMGAPEVAVCERGIVTFNDHCRWTFDAAAVAALKCYTELRVVGDPSHGTGRADLVPSLARVSAAAGADGVMVEVHPDPKQSISDADQAISVEEFGKVVKSCSAIWEAN